MVYSLPVRLQSLRNGIVLDFSAYLSKATGCRVAEIIGKPNGRRDLAEIIGEGAGDMRENGGATRKPDCTVVV